MSWSIDQIMEACGGELRGEPSHRIAGVSTDTRTLRAGQLFVAIEGERFDGHDFLEEAVSRGASGALISREARVPIPTIRVQDTVRALAQLASSRRKAFRGPVIAITGSNGKTTTKEMCADILTAAGLRVRRSPGNLNNHIGLPLSVLALEDGDEVLVVELGMNRAGEIDELARIVSPDVGAITQVAPAHLGPLGSIDAIARAKGELFERLAARGVAVINADDPRVRAQGRRFKGRHLLFGSSPEADFRGTEPHEAQGSDAFVLKTPIGERRIRLALPGRHLMEDALCAAAAAWASGLLEQRPLESIAVGLESFEPLQGRLRVLQAPGGLTLLDDSYNANPHSMEAALRTLGRLRGQGRTISVLGDMLELGPAAQELHRAAGELAARLGIDIVIGMGELATHLVHAARQAGVKDAHTVPDTAAATACIRRFAASGDTVLVKGSRSMHMERVIAALQEAQ